MSDRIMVMNQGKIEEMGDADTVCAHPQTDYTRKLIGAIPKGELDDIRRAMERKRVLSN
jgi:peptide/nickel transport system ATP-binding protein